MFPRRSLAYPMVRLHVLPPLGWCRRRDNRKSKIRKISRKAKTRQEGVGVAGGGQFMSASWVGGMGNHTGTISKQGTRKTFLIIPVRFAIVHFLPRSAPAAPKSVCVLLESY